jgi:hypothetical protein
VAESESSPYEDCQLFVSVEKKLYSNTVNCIYRLKTNRSGKKLLAG